MATINAWEKEFKGLSDKDKQRFLSALETLSDWNFYTDNYSEIFSLLTILKRVKGDTQHG